MLIIICDDSTEEREILRKYIHLSSNVLGLDYIIEEFDSAEALLNALHARKVQPDILFMDIYMEKMNGMDAAKILVEKGFDGAIIFTTTSESHAVKSYEIMAKGYLVKPYSYESFHRNFLYATQHHTESYKTLSFPCNRLEFHVFLKDLEYIESYQRGSLLHAKGEVFKTTKSVSSFAQELSKEENFVRTHQGCIVNLNFVEFIGEDSIQMKSGAKAPLAFRNRQSVRKCAADYFFLKMRTEQ